MTADDLARAFIDARISRSEFHSRLMDIPGPSAHRWLALHTEWENSNWDDAELRRRAQRLLDAA